MKIVQRRLDWKFSRWRKIETNAQGTCLPSCVNLIVLSKIRNVTHNMNLIFKEFAHSITGFFQTFFQSGFLWWLLIFVLTLRLRMGFVCKISWTGRLNRVKRAHRNRRLKSRRIEKFANIIRFKKSRKISFWW